MINADLRNAREAVVRSHMEAEGRGDLDAAVKAFTDARYEVVPTGEIHDGKGAVYAFLGETMKAFPDMHFETHALHHTDDALIAEVTFVGTHRDVWRGVPPTGRVARYRMCNVFAFRNAESAELVCERLYFDLLTALRSLGLARDPNSLAGKIGIVANHPLAIAKAAIGQVVSKISK